MCTRVQGPEVDLSITLHLSFLTRGLSLNLELSSLDRLDGHQAPVCALQTVAFQVPVPRPPFDMDVGLKALVRMLVWQTLPQLSMCSQSPLP